MDKISLVKVYLMAFDGGDGSMGVTYFDSVEACKFAEAEEPETYCAEGYYPTAWIEDDDTRNIWTIRALQEEFLYDLNLGTLPSAGTGPCTLALQ